MEGERRERKAVEVWEKSEFKGRSAEKPWLQTTNQFTIACTECWSTDLWNQLVADLTSDPQTSIY